MTTIDISRSANDPAKRYTSVRLQQGRVITDDDWNDAERISAHERVESLTDIIGSSGTSDDALLVSNVITAGGRVDFDLGDGTFFLAGRRLPVPVGQRYQLQDDWFAPTDVGAPAAARNDLVWVEVQEHPVTALEDAELREVGLGGPDTSTRIRLQYRVHVQRDVDADCEVAWEATVGDDVDARGILATDANLTVDFVPNTVPDDLCTPEVAGGYLSHMNQAIRVQAIDDHTFTWGFDNASSVYRVDLGADRQTISFRNSPVDEAHRPRSGQVVELLPWASVLPNHQVQAGIVGAFGVVDQSFDPDTDQLTLAAPVAAFGELDWAGHPDAAEMSADGTYVYLRVWDRGTDPSAPDIAMNIGNPVPLGTTGLQVTFSGSARTGDHWILAARPAEPTRVVPWNLRQGRPPHGPVRARAPLAILRWDAAGNVTVGDCRRRFRPLTELNGCCEITVGDGSRSFGDVESIQQAVDLLPPEGGRVCVRAGRYDERISIVNRKFVEIIGCGPDTIISPQSATGPVFAVDGSVRVVLASMGIVTRDGGAVAVGSAAACDRVHLDELSIRAGATAPAIRVTSPTPAREMTRRVRITTCDVQVNDLDRPPDDGSVVELWPALWLRAVRLDVFGCTVSANSSKVTSALGGIQVASLSERVRLRDNEINGGNGNGITLGSIVWVPDDVFDLAAIDYMSFVGIVSTLGWFVWFDDGCIQIGGRPPADDDDRPVLVPVSLGPVVDVAIERCVVTNMAADGIGVAWFFDPADERHADIIVIDRLRIDDNHIIGNRRTAPPVVGADLARMSGHGGVSLGLVRDLRLRQNRILSNGRIADDPTCGVFILRGEGLLINGNDIIDNGSQLDAERVARIGNRGGIVVKSCRDLPAESASGAQVRSIGALTVHDNRVAQPAGQAVWVVGLGRISVHDNQLTGGGLGLTEILTALFRFVEGNTAELRSLVLLAAQHLVGSAVTIIDVGLPFDLITLGRKSDDVAGPSAPVGFSRVAGMMSVVDAPAGTQAAYMAAPQEAETAASHGDLAASISKSPKLSTLLVGGHVSFNDNQVALDLLGDERSLSLCSVLVASLDDVAFQHNQVRCLTQVDWVLVDVVAAGLLSVRSEGNRVQDAIPLLRRGQGGVLISMLTWALMNVTTSNITTMPLIANGSASKLVDEHNVRLV